MLGCKVQRERFTDLEEADIQDVLNSNTAELHMEANPCQPNLSVLNVLNVQDDEKD
jgi:hypothetical protein